MKRVIFLCLMAFGLCITACHSNDDTWGDWSKTSEFAGKARTGAVSFKIGEIVFVGLGYNAEATNKKDYALRDFWKFDGTTWTQMKDSFPATGRYGSIAFAIGNKAYVGTGFLPTDKDFEKRYFDDIYECEYIGGELVWNKTQLTSVPGDGRCDAIAFAINGKGYVGTGAVDGDVVKDFYSYDPASNSWSTIGFPGDSRRGAVAMVFSNNQAIVCLGAKTQSGSYVNDVYRFDPASTTLWTSCNPLVDRDNHGYDNDYPKIPRVYSVAFTSTMDRNIERGYVATGAGPSSRTCWEYRPDEDRWYEVTELLGVMSSRVQGVGFSINNYGYVGMGSTNVQSNNTAGNYYKDFWKFEPGADEDDWNDYN